jgi:anti-anti-sigma factor
VSDLARVDAERRGESCVVRIDGEIDLSNAAKIGEEIERSIPPDVADIVLDLSGTAYLDSAGISLLVRLAQRLRSRRQQIRIVTPEDSAIRAVLQLAGLSELLPMSTTLENPGA